MVYKVLISVVFRSMTNDNSITIQEYIISEEHKKRRHLIIVNCDVKTRYDIVFKPERLGALIF